jgi:acyl-CoA thioesterase-1
VQAFSSATPHHPAEAVERMIRYRNLERALEWLPEPSDEQLATLLHVDAAQYRRVCECLEQQARRAARELLEEPAVAENVDRLPLSRGARILGVGDSMMADRLSFLEILRHALSLRRPRDGIEVSNQAVSGDRSCDLLARAGLLARTADWTLCLVGTNDAMRIGRRVPATVVSFQESVRNLAALRRELGSAPGARWTWIAPPPIDPPAAEDTGGVADASLHFRPQDVEALRQHLRGLSPSVVIDAGPDDLEADGLHPSLRGQMRICRALVASMARPAGATAKAGS